MGNFKLTLRGSKANYKNYNKTYLGDNVLFSSIIYIHMFWCLLVKVWLLYEWNNFAFIRLSSRHKVSNNYIYICYIYIYSTYYMLIFFNSECLLEVIGIIII